MKPTDQDPRGYKVVYMDPYQKGFITCMYTYRYHAAKRFKDWNVAQEQRRKEKRRYYIFPLRKKDKKEWRELPF